MAESSDECLENGTEKISEVDLCAEPIKQLKPMRDHMTVLKILMSRIISKMML